MQLSAEHFERILSALRSDSPASTTKDKRRRPRVGLRASISLVEAGEDGKGVRLNAMIRDISREGVGIQCSCVMKAGQRFLVLMPSKSGAAHSILCTVRHCKLVTDNTYHVGATFIRVCNVTPKSDPHTGTSAESARIRKAILA